MDILGVAIVTAANWFTPGNRCRKRCARRVQIRLSNGAGEGIRTLDPNLGKVVLYP